MKYKVVSGIMLILLLTGMLTLTSYIQLAGSEPKTIIVPDDYEKIQWAVGNASDGDTIFVKAGTYREHIIIDKPLVLEGESNQNTTIKAQKTGSMIGIHILASNVTIKGFKITYDVASTMLVFIDGRVHYVVNNTIKDNIFVNKGTDTIAMPDSGSNKIQNNTFHLVDDTYGISGVYSNSNIIDNNNLIGGHMSIVLLNGFNSTISNNFITNQTSPPAEEYGAIMLLDQPSNVITGNTITRNENGIRFLRSSGNSIYNNSFIDNVNHVLIDEESDNIWDNDYPSGGNYWNDYTCPDIYSGPYQNETGSDGIGDLPYVIDGDNKDRYPLVPYGYVPGPDLNKDGIVDIVDIVMVALSFGSKRGDPDWNPCVDLNQDGIIDIVDIVIIAIHFGKTYP